MYFQHAKPLFSSTKLNDEPPSRRIRIRFCHEWFCAIVLLWDNMGESGTPALIFPDTFV